MNSLEISSEVYGAFLVPLLTDKLPTSLRLSVVQKMTSETWNLSYMMYYFKIELVAHERCGTVNVNSDNRNSDIEEDYTCAFSNLSKSTNFCVFCKQRHPSYKRRKVTDISQRKPILRKNGSCFLCLENCSVNYQCNKCKGKHNITICEGPRKFDPNAKKDSNLAPIIQDNETLTKLKESRHSILLQTAYSNVFNNELSLSSTAHIMFDSSIQKSYIAADLKKKLHLKTIRNEKIIKTFGLTEGKVSIADVVNLKNKCRNNEFVNIEALCVPVICFPFLGQKPFEISKIHTEFRKLYLADFKPNIEEKNISILIGLDYYFSFIKGNFIRSENDNLVALESKLAWILSGTHETGERVSSTHIYRVDSFSQKSEPRMFNNKE